MPCYSSVKTEIRDAERLLEALRAVGFVGAEVTGNGLVVGIGGRPLFSRGRTSDPFASVQYQSNLGADHVAAIGRKYAELGVKAFAKRRGFAIASDDGQRIVLKNRRS